MQACHPEPKQAPWMAGPHGRPLILVVQAFWTLGRIARAMQRSRLLRCPGLPLRFCMHTLTILGVFAICAGVTTHCLNGIGVSRLHIYSQDGASSHCLFQGDLGSYLSQ